MRMRVTALCFGQEHIKLWHERNPDQNFQQCIQESGDLVYVPDGWGHAVENLAESVGSVHDPLVTVPP